MPDSEPKASSPASLLVGVTGSIVAFFVTIGLEGVTGDTYFAFFVGAVALSCCLAGWRSGVASTAAGLLGVALVLPPTFTITIDSPADVLRLVLFSLICTLICAISFMSDRRENLLRVVQRRSDLFEVWIQSAQKETLLWTWELDLDHSFLAWRNPYAEVASQEFRSFDIWVKAVVLEDRDRFETAMMDAIVTGNLHVQYKALTSRGLHRLVSRGVAVDHPDEPGARRLVGITLDLDSREVSAVPSSPQQRREDSHLVLALIGLSDLLFSIQHNDGLDTNSRSELARAREQISKMLIADIAS